MAKKIDGYIKLQIKAGQANPAPPIGPALGQHGVNIMEFCKQYNAATQDRMGLVLPVVITVYVDKSFTFIVKSPPAARSLLFVVGAVTGSSCCIGMASSRACKHALPGSGDFASITKFWSGGVSHGRRPRMASHFPPLVRGQWRARP